MKNTLYLIIGIIIVVAIIYAIARGPAGEENTNASTNQAIENLNAAGEPANTNAAGPVNATTNTATTNATQNTNAATTNANTNTATFSFSSPKKSAHYVANSPTHSAVLTKPPASASINFNFDLIESSTVSITREGKEYGSGSATVSSDKRTLSRTLDSSAPDGLYTVNYNACWPDNTCHSGYFQFAIDRP